MLQINMETERMWIMKIHRRIVGVMLSIMMIFTVLPLQAFATETLSGDNDEFYIGTDYEMTLKTGSTVSVLEWTGILKADMSVEIQSVKSSDTDVATVSNAGAGEIRITGVAEGTAVITVEGLVYAGDDGGDGELKTTEITVNVTADGTSKDTSKKTTKKVEKKSTIKSNNWIFKDSTKVKVVATNVKRGDIIRLKIGKKTYTKKVKSTKAKLTATIKIKKPGFYGKKYTLSLRRKGKTIASSKEYVYLSKTVYTGYTKKQVKWLVYWNDPDKKKKSASSEKWCYDWEDDGRYDAYLYFKNGKVSGWKMF